MEINNKMQVTIDQLRKVKGIGEKTIERIIEQYAEPSVYDTSCKPYKAHELDYRDESNWLMYGDCLERMREIPDGSVDMIMVDVPYGTTACKWDEIIPLEPMWESINRVVKNSAAIVMTSSQPFTTILINSNIENFAHAWVWNKRFAGNFVQARRQPLKDHEDVIVFCKSGKQPSYYPQMIDREEPIKQGGNGQKEGKAIPIAKTEAWKKLNNNKKTYDKKFPTTTTTVFSNRGAEDRGLHFTQKPVALGRYLIRTYTNEGETVLDFTFGSGTTGVACRNSNRKFIGIELDENYYKLGRDRILNGDK